MATEAVTIFVVIAVTLTLIVIGVPPIRDGLLIRLSQQRRDWLITHKSNLIPWIDWCRIVFEIALALFISNQVFNEHIRTFFENSLDRLKRSLTLRIEKSVERDDARVKIKQAIQEMIVFMYFARTY
ncbi:MAG TPA: hypothetical protein VKB05_16260 [Pyrinomonadaceae bacterium]|nr:hypothetical protein [Pyrinomonadaceae bacterium]